MTKAINEFAQSDAYKSAAAAAARALQKANKKATVKPKMIKGSFKQSDVLDGLISAFEIKIHNFQLNVTCLELSFVQNA